MKSYTLIVYEIDLVDCTHLLKKYRHHTGIVQLKILHLSDASLPDWRTEKSAITASNCGHEVIFAGIILDKDIGIWTVLLLLISDCNEDVTAVTAALYLSISSLDIC